MAIFSPINTWLNLPAIYSPINTCLNLPFNGHFLWKCLVYLLIHLWLICPGCHLGRHVILVPSRAESKTTFRVLSSCCIRLNSCISLLYLLHVTYRDNHYRIVASTQMSASRGVVGSTVFYLLPHQQSWAGRLKHKGMHLDSQRHTCSGNGIGCVSWHLAAWGKHKYMVWPLLPELAAVLDCR